LGGWTALVATKQGHAAKSRLSDLLDLPARTALAGAMAAHVVACLHAVEAVAQVRVIAPAAPVPPGTIWMPDTGGGLNAELRSACARLADRPIFVIHADLPFLGPDDVTAFLAAADRAGAAIAPDRHDRGTNALALSRGHTPAFAFGSDSFARHFGQWPDAAIVRRRGLAFDLDTPDDFREADRSGVLPMAGDRV
jgi:2-phospho-L-lactate guanylyltransferase